MRKPNNLTLAQLLILYGEQWENFDAWRIGALKIEVRLHGETADGDSIFTVEEVLPPRISAPQK